MSTSRPIPRSQLGALVRELPKAEVHLHLEGCIPSPVWLAAAERHGMTCPLPLVDGRPEITSLQALLDHLDWACSLVDRAEDLRAIALATSQHLDRSGALHADVIFNPTHWPHWRERAAEMVGELSAGFDEAERAGGATVNLCWSLNRRQSEAEANDVVDWLLAERAERVVGLSIDGNEAAGSNNERFAGAFRRAADAGLRRCAHAGESSGPGGVWEAIELLGAERIDHGVRCVEEPALVRELARRRIPLDVCPTSNVVLGVAESIAAHPVEALRRAGVRVSVNTDDPELYGIELAGEYEACAAEFRWGARQLGEVARTSIEASFASEDRKAAMLERLESFLEATIGGA